MNYLHFEEDAGPDDIIEVTLDGQANVLLMDGVNYGHYKNGRAYHYHGGLPQVSPVQLSPPRQGHWHVVVDLGGYAGRVGASVRVLKSSVRAS
jgi:hypothetical protein